MSKPTSATASTTNAFTGDKPSTATATDDKKLILQKKISSAFDIFDSQKNKTCDIREVGSIVRSLGIYPSEQQLHEWIKEMEEEEPTGYIKYEKLERILLSILLENRQTRDDEELIYRAFKALDSDEKGYLTPDELKEFMTLNGEKFTNEELDEMLNFSIDPAENKIFYDDYVKILAQ